jgi:nitrite reductase/ring-hydroxylating ferredoxin subunit
LTDYQHVDPPARRVGLVHGLINVASVILFGGSLIARRKGNRGVGRSLSTLGYVLSAAAAQLGGDLVYSYKIGVDHTSSEKLPADFMPVLPESDLREAKPTRAQHEGTPILLVRRGAQIYAIAETCSHLGGPLAEGELDGDVIQCPWHGSRFSLRDGHVVDGPAVHPQPCLEARVRDGQIEVKKADCQASVTRKGPATQAVTEPTRTGTVG